MQITGRYVIGIPPAAVWASLNDPDVLRVCVPGCVTLEKIDENRFAGSGKIKIGPQQSTFSGQIELAQWEPPRRCILKGEGQGDAGFAEGEAEVLLAPQDEGTVLALSVTATVGGEFAEIDQTLIDDAAQQIVDDFLVRFSAEVTAAKTVPALDQPDVAPVAPAQILQNPPPPPPLRETVGPEIWVVGLIAIIVILLILFGLVL